MFVDFFSCHQAVTLDPAPTVTQSDSAYQILGGEGLCGMYLRLEREGTGSEVPGREGEWVLQHVCTVTAVPDD